MGKPTEELVRREYKDQVWYETRPTMGITHGTPKGHEKRHQDLRELHEDNGEGVRR